VFNPEIERKIIDFIKKSPFGVSSSEIAKYIGLNRITLTKYLAVIRQKALIDFKQFGMAKLWFIPIRLNREIFLNKSLDYLAVNLSKAELRKAAEKAGLSLGEEINSMYLQFYGIPKLGLEQLCDAYLDIGKKIGARFEVILIREKISVKMAESPFESKVREMNALLSALFTKIAALNLGYARSTVIEPKNGTIVIDIYLKKGS